MGTGIDSSTASDASAVSREWGSRTETEAFVTSRQKTRRLQEILCEGSRSLARRGSNLRGVVISKGRRGDKMSAHGKTKRKCNNKSSLCQRASGYTLVELVLTLATSGVLLTSAVGSINTGLERKQLIHAAEAIESDLQLVRQQALTTNTSMVVSWNAGTAWCYGMDTSTCNCVTTSDCGVKEVSGATLAPRVSVTDATFSGASAVTFDRVRGMADSSGNIDLQGSSGLDLRVELLASSRTRICSPSDTIAGYPAC